MYPGRPTDVFVIGGGPAGLAVAIAARQAGFSVTLADGAVPPIDKACGEGIMPDGIEAAQALGIALPAAVGHPFHGIRFSNGDTMVQAEFPKGKGVGIRRTELHRLLAQRACDAGVQMEWGMAIQDFSSIRARWIVGADGSQSAVRRWAGLDIWDGGSPRYGFRRHFNVLDTPDFMELHWGDRCQVYLTPIGPREICAALISHDPRLRTADISRLFPSGISVLRGAQPAGPERGGVTVSRRLKAVVRGNIALVGDASGSVDAITGEGLCLVFRQSIALARAMAAGDLSGYQSEHARIGRRPEWMSRMLLLLDGRPRLRRRALHALARDPALFASFLAMHLGEFLLPDFLTNGLTLGWRMLSL